MATFANPFALDCDPFQWRALQAELEQRLSAGMTEEEAFLELSLPAPTGASFVQLTEEQRASVDEIMLGFEATLDRDTTSWLLGDALLRAQRAAARPDR